MGGDLIWGSSIRWPLFSVKFTPTFEASGLNALSAHTEISALEMEHALIVRKSSHFSGPGWSRWMSWTSQRSEHIRPFPFSIVSIWVPLSHSMLVP